jgi:hypothetical protein
MADSLLTSHARQDFAIRPKTQTDRDLVIGILELLMGWLKNKEKQETGEDSPSEGMPGKTPIWRINSLPRDPGDPFYQRTAGF